MQWGSSSLGRLRACQRRCISSLKRGGMELVHSSISQRCSSLNERSNSGLEREAKIQKRILAEAKTPLQGPFIDQEAAEIIQKREMVEKDNTATLDRVIRYAEDGEVEEAKKWLLHYANKRAVDENTINKIIKASMKNGPETVGQWYDTMLKMNLRPSTETYDMLVTCHTQQFDTAGAEEWLLRMRQDFWTENQEAVLNICARSGLVNYLSEWMNEAISNGATLSRGTYTFAVAAFCNANMISASQEALVGMLRAGHVPHDISFNQVVSSLCATSNTKVAEEWMKFAIEHKLSSSGCYIPFLKHYIQTDSPSEFLHTVSVMKDLGVRVMCRRDFHILVKGLKKFKGAEYLMHFLEDHTGDNDADSLIYNDSLEIMLGAKDSAAVRKILKYFKNPDERTCGIILKAMTEEPPRKSIEFLARMVSVLGIKPNLVHYNFALRACAHANDAKAAEALYEILVSKGLRPSILTFELLAKSCMFDDNKMKKWMDKVRNFKPELNGVSVSPETFYSNESSLMTNNVPEQRFPRQQSLGRTYNMLIRRNLERQDVVKAHLLLIHAMEVSKIELNPAWCNMVASGYRHLNDRKARRKGVIKIVRDMRRLQLPISPYIYNLLIELNLGRNALKEILRRCKDSCKFGLILKNMRLDGARPTEDTYVTMLKQIGKNCESAENVKNAKNAVIQILLNLHKDKRNFTRDICFQAISALKRLGIREGKLLDKLIMKIDDDTFKAYEYLKLSRIDEALDVVKSMSLNGKKPELHLRRRVLLSLVHLQKFEDAVDFFLGICNGEKCLFPVVTSVYAETGNMSKIIDLRDRALGPDPSGWDLDCYELMLQACSNSKPMDIETARSIFNSFKLSPPSFEDDSTSERVRLQFKTLLNEDVDVRMVSI